MWKPFYILNLLLIANIGTVFAQVQSKTELDGKTAYIRGMEAFVNEEYEDARDLLLEAYNQLDAPASVSYALADVYGIMGDIPNAALYGKQAVAFEPQNKWYRFKLAEIYKSAGQNQATLDELNTLLEYHPTDYDALFMLAETYRSYGEYLKSNEILNRAQKLTGPNRGIVFMKFRNFEALQVMDSMRVQLETLRDLNPDDLTTLNLLSKYYYFTGDKEEAKSVLADALERNSRDPESLINMAEIYISAQKWDSAGTLMGNFISDKLIDADDKLEVAKYMYTRHNNEPGNIQLKIETSRLIDLFAEEEPDYGHIFVLAGQFYAQNNQVEEALEKLKRGNELLPNDEIAWRQRLQLLHSQSRFDETVETGKEANSHVPEDAYIQFFIGTAHYLQEQHEDAVEWLQSAAMAPARRPTKSMIYSSLGDALNSVNKFEESVEAYEMALRYDPENHLAMNNYAYHLSVRGVELEKAKEMALKAIDTEPKNAAYLDTVGWIYFKLGDYERARRYVRASIETGESSAEVAEHLGDIYEKLDNINEARKWWQKALETDEKRSYLKDKIEGTNQ